MYHDQPVALSDPSSLLLPSSSSLLSSSSSPPSNAAPATASLLRDNEYTKLKHAMMQREALSAITVAGISHGGIDGEAAEQIHQQYQAQQQQQEKAQPHNFMNDPLSPALPTDGSGFAAPLFVPRHYHVNPVLLLSNSGGINATNALLQVEPLHVDLSDRESFRSAMRRAEDRQQRQHGNFSHVTSEDIETSAVNTFTRARGPESSSDDRSLAPGGRHDLLTTSHGGALSKNSGRFNLAGMPNRLAFAVGDPIQRAAASGRNNNNNNNNSAAALLDNGSSPGGSIKSSGSGAESGREGSGTQFATGGMDRFSHRQDHRRHSLEVEDDRLLARNHTNLEDMFAAYRGGTMQQQQQQEEREQQSGQCHDVSSDRSGGGVGSDRHHEDDNGEEPLGPNLSGADVIEDDQGGEVVVTEAEIENHHPPHCYHQRQHDHAPPVRISNYTFKPLSGGDADYGDSYAQHLNSSRSSGSPRQTAGGGGAGRGSIGAPMIEKRREVTLFPDSSNTNKNRGGGSDAAQFQFPRVADPFHSTFAGISRQPLFAAVQASTSSLSNQRQQMHEEEEEARDAEDLRRLNNSSYINRSGSMSTAASAPLDHKYSFPVSDVQSSLAQTAPRFQTVDAFMKAAAHERRSEVARREEVSQLTAVTPIAWSRPSFAEQQRNSLQRRVQQDAAAARLGSPSSSPPSTSSPQRQQRPLSPLSSSVERQRPRHQPLDFSTPFRQQQQQQPPDDVVELLISGEGSSVAERLLAMRRVGAEKLKTADSAPKAFASWASPQGQVKPPLTRRQVHSPASSSLVFSPIIPSRQPPPLSSYHLHYEYSPPSYDSLSSPLVAPGFSHRLHRRHHNLPLSISTPPPRTLPAVVPPTYPNVSVPLHFRPVHEEKQQVQSSQHQQRCAEILPVFVEDPNAELERCVPDEVAIWASQSMAKRQHEAQRAADAAEKQKARDEAAKAGVDALVAHSVPTFPKPVAPMLLFKKQQELQQQHKQHQPSSSIHGRGAGVIVPQKRVTEAPAFDMYDCVPDEMRVTPDEEAAAGAATFPAPSSNAFSASAVGPTDSLNSADVDNNNNSNNNSNSVSGGMAVHPLVLPISVTESISSPAMSNASSASVHFLSQVTDPLRAVAANNDAPDTTLAAAAALAELPPAAAAALAPHVLSLPVTASALADLPAAAPHLTGSQIASKVCPPMLIVQPTTTGGVASLSVDIGDQQEQQEQPVNCARVPVESDALFTPPSRKSAPL